MPNDLMPELIHAVMLMVEALIVAAFGVFLWLVLPACRRSGPPRR